MAKKETNLNYKKALYETIIGYKNSLNLPVEGLLETFGSETSKIINKKIDPDAEIIFEIDNDKQEVSIFNNKISVVEDDSEIINETGYLAPISFIELKNAKKIKKDVEVGDSIKIELALFEILNEAKKAKASNPLHSENAKTCLKTIESTLKQGIKLLQKQQIFDKYSKLIGKSVKIMFNSKNKNGSWNVQLVEDNVSAYLPANLVNSKRNIKPGSYEDAIVESVDPETKFNQVCVSLDSPKIVEDLLRNSIPEINQGLIEIVNLVRQPGERSKVAVKKTNLSSADFDVYGAIIGPNASRIESIISQLKGEKIDVVLYSENPIEFISNALSPAKVVDIKVKDAEKGKYLAIVPDNAVTLAIGRRGINASLASNLTNNNIDIISVSDARSKKIQFDETLVDELTQMFQNKKSDIFTRRQSNRRTRRGNSYNNNNYLSSTDFDLDIAQYKEKESEDFDIASNGYEDLDFEELFRKHSSENVEKTISDDIETEQIKKSFSNKKSEAQLKSEAEKVIEEFEVDEDLSSFGLDGDFDISDFDDEDWN
ncbi:NusA N-terminal domain-containing protein [Mycoplasma sp. Mirounga ES2805-ORL]|uniref:NusA N-terminal domain-containing protein n=1 Tax=Mycoplasma sp. Mirounga ES2805-ORL TaxID=754514 RepID=UPI00197BA76F|nr:NusA N-terminal domain-containing protein [Mycoplasma sp. Mirounga ES2805-ORL]QSF13565.1 transcription termination/antitermination protein NusA [Mycoplasma sp. Mirounga ES2805-ORL]